MSVLKRIATAFALLLLLAVLGFGALFWWYGPRAQAILEAERPDSLSVSKLDDETLLIYGPVEIGDYEKVFKPAFDSTIRTVVLDSGSGDVSATLSMAEDMSAQGVDIRVRHFCFSSCANYLFTAGKHRILDERAVVGFHGNAQATFQDMDDTFGMSAEEIAENPERLAEYRRMVDELLARERSFFSAHVIDQALFDRTQRPDKGVEGESYAFLAPTQATFQRYGYFNVEGTQSKAEIERLSGLSQDILLD